MSGKLNEFGRRRSRRWWIAGATLVAFASFVVVGVGAASARTDGQPKSHHVVRHVVAGSIPGLVANPAMPHVRYLMSAIGTIGTGGGFEDNDGDLTQNNGTPLSNQQERLTLPMHPSRFRRQ
jgi:hypothetical protein